MHVCCHGFPVIYDLRCSYSMVNMDGFPGGPARHKPERSGGGPLKPEPPWPVITYSFTPGLLDIFSHANESAVDNDADGDSFLKRLKHFFYPFSSLLPTLPTMQLTTTHWHFIQICVCVLCSWQLGKLHAWSFLFPNLRLIVWWGPLVAVLIMTRAKEEGRWASFKTDIWSRNL